MLHVFYIFHIVPAKELQIGDLKINTQLDDGEFCSQFGIVAQAKDETFLVPVYSFCENSLTNLKNKIYKHIEKEVKDSQKFTEDVSLVFSVFARFTRIDLMKLRKQKNELVFEFVQECKPDRTLYQTINVFAYNTLRDIDICIFSSIVNKEIMLASGDYA